MFVCMDIRDHQVALWLGPTIVIAKLQVPALAKTEKTTALCSQTKPFTPIVSVQPAVKMDTWLQSGRKALIAAQFAT